MLISWTATVLKLAWNNQFKSVTIQILVCVLFFTRLDKYTSNTTFKHDFMIFFEFIPLNRSIIQIIQSAMYATGTRGQNFAKCMHACENSQLRRNKVRWKSLLPEHFECIYVYLWNWSRVEHLSFHQWTPGKKGIEYDKLKCSLTSRNVNNLQGNPKQQSTTR